MKVFDLLEIVDKICPFEDAFDDDKVGLLIGSGTNEVSGIVVSHDLEKSTLDYCKENNVNTVISYHPATYKKFDDLKLLAFAKRYEEIFKYSKIKPKFNN